MVTRRQVCVSVIGAALLSGCGNPIKIDPAAAWTKITDGPLSARHNAVGGWLAGRFVIAGGFSTEPCPPGADCAPSELPALRDGAAFAPSTGAWSSLPDAPTPIVGGYRSAVVGERLYVLTEEIGRPDSPESFACYDATQNSWLALPQPPRTDVTLIGTDPAGLIAIGGSDEQGQTSDFRFDPAQERWIRLPDDPIGPSFNREGVWLGDRLLLTACDLVPNPGWERPAVARLATWDPASGRWAGGPDTEVIGGGPTWVSGRVVWPTLGSADGGRINNWGRPYPYGAILDPATEEWTALPSPPSGRGLGGVTMRIGNTVAVGGHLLNPATLAWAVIPEVPTVDREGATVIPGDDAVLAWGGADGNTNLADGYLLRLT